MARAIRVAGIVDCICYVAGGIVYGRARVMSYSTHGILGGVYCLPGLVTNLFNVIAHIIGHVARRIPCIVNGVLYGIFGLVASARDRVFYVLECLRDTFTQILQESSYLLAQALGSLGGCVCRIACSPTCIVDSIIHFLFRVHMRIPFPIMFDYWEMLAHTIPHHARGGQPYCKHSASRRQPVPKYHTNNPADSASIIYTGNDQSSRRQQ